MTLDTAEFDPFRPHDTKALAAAVAQSAEFRQRNEPALLTPKLSFAALARRFA
jgi:hypothetical protein